MTSRPVVLTAALAAALLLGLGFATAEPHRGIDTSTPASLVASYDSLADAILAVKTTEANLVRSILSTGYAHAQAGVERARAALDSGDADRVRTELETLAALVAQLGAEGDNAVAAVRKRLIEGGHHHHADGEAKGIYDTGYVIVTKAAKQQLLDASKSLATAKDRAALDAAWMRVEATWNDVLGKPE
jgi:hypothetical protein